MQYTSADHMIRMIQDGGVEFAVKNCHRATGRTTRAILKVLLGLSQGEWIIYRVTGQGEQRLSFQHDFFNRLMTHAGLLGMGLSGCRDELKFDPSGGRIKVFNETQNHRGQTQWWSDPKWVEMGEY